METTSKIPFLIVTKIIFLMKKSASATRNATEVNSIQLDVVSRAGIVSILTWQIHFVKERASLMLKRTWAIEYATTPSMPINVTLMEVRLCDLGHCHYVYC